jgi:uncharacterized protein
MTFVADGVERELDPRFVPWRHRRGIVGTLASAAIYGGIVTALVLLAPLPTAAKTALWSALAAFVVGRAWWGYARPMLDMRHTRYRVDWDGIEIRRGIWFRSIITIPRTRVQHTDVSQGPMERSFGLGTLVVHTAGSSHAQVSFAGLAHEDAVAIRDWLLPRAAAHGA